MLGRGARDGRGRQVARKKPHSWLGTLAIAAVVAVAAVPAAAPSDRFPGSQLTIEEALDRSEAVVVATVREVAHVGPSRPLGVFLEASARVTVTDTWKGLAGGTLDLRYVVRAQPLGRDEALPEVGQSYLFILHGTTAVKVLPITPAIERAVREQLRSDLDRLQGRWLLVDEQSEGKYLVRHYPPRLLVISGTQATEFIEGKQIAAWTFQLNPTVRPRQIERTRTWGPATGQTESGIYRLEGFDVVEFHFTEPGRPRPQTFQTRLGAGQVVSRYAREVPPAARGPIPARSGN